AGVPWQEVLVCCNAIRPPRPPLPPPLPSRRPAMKRSFLVPSTLMALCLVACQAFGQNLEREQLSISGTIKGVAPGAFQVAVSEKEVWLIKIDPNIKQVDMTFSGSAEKTFLRPGMYVEFRAQVNKRGTVLEPVASLTVF